MRHEFRGLLLGALGIVAFSFTLPATRIAVTGGFDAVFIGVARSVVAGGIAALILIWRREPIPSISVIRRLMLVAAGVVFGFPFLSSLAMGHVTSAHGAVLTGMLPCATAIMAVLRARERPSLAFWGAASIGLIAISVFGLSQGGGRFQYADLLLAAAMICGAVGYAEGGALARQMGGWRVICWALVISLPLLLPVALIAAHRQEGHPGFSAWIGFAYVATVSALFGFFAWYRALVLGGIARIGQMQLAQPVLTLLWSALLLGEHVSIGTVLAALAVLASVGLTLRLGRQPDEIEAVGERSI